METLALEARVLQQTYTEVQRRFSNLDDLAHGWEHIQRVYTTALALAQKEGADRFVVGMAALMHDLGRTVPHSGASETHKTNGRHSAEETEETEEAGEIPARHHADISVELAREILNAFQVPSEKQQAIIHAIVAHSFSRNIEPLTLEAGIVRDADRLDGLGALGIMRWAITGTLRHTPRSYAPEDPFVERHTPDDKRYMLDHFYSKLFKLAGTMTTETGRALAEQRTAFMRAYLDQLRIELEQ